MRDNDLYERFECIHPPRHRKLYELEVEAALFYPKALIRRWGRIGTRHSRTRRGLYALPEEPQKAVEAVRRMRHGYHLVSTVGMMGARRVSLTPEPANPVIHSRINPLESMRVETVQTNAVSLASERRQVLQALRLADRIRIG